MRNLMTVFLFITGLVPGQETTVSLNYPDQVIAGSDQNHIQIVMNDSSPADVSNVESNLETNVYLSFDEYNPEDGTIEIWIETEVDISGAQFIVSGFHITDAVGGYIITSQFFMLAFNEDGQLLLFGMESYIPPGEHLFCTLYFDQITDDQSCFQDLIFSGDYGQPIENTDHDECIDTGACGMMGDLNNDGEIDVLDVVITANCILYEYDCFCADLDGNGIVDVLDIVAMVETILAD